MVLPAIASRVATKIFRDAKGRFISKAKHELRQRTSKITPIMLQLKFEDDKTMKLFGGSKRQDLATLNAGAEKEYKWVIISPPGKSIDISLWARNGGGKTKKKIVLK